jgi:3D-(3,5/4)-trihydroxycyclohexane-1,2-dione acylhydrolase (decyclizing)
MLPKASARWSMPGARRGREERGMTIRLTMAQALTRWIAAQKTVSTAGRALFRAASGRSSAMAMSPASARRWLSASRTIRLPTYRAHNEQAWRMRRSPSPRRASAPRAMACTTSIGPGATNMVTAAALAHVNRLPVLFLPGDVFANRRPDPGAAADRGFRRRHGERRTTASARSRAISTASPGPSRSSAAAARHGGADRSADCGPVTLALCQDVQAEAFDYPESFFDERVWTHRRRGPMRRRTGTLVARSARRRSR